MSDVEHAIASVTNFVNRLMADEMLNLLDPKLAFGESFEILILDPKIGFRYLDNILYFVIDAIMDANYKILKSYFTGPAYKINAHGNYCLAEKYYPSQKHTDFILISPLGCTDEILENQIMAKADPATYRFVLESDYYCGLVRFITTAGDLFEFLSVTIKHGNPNVGIDDNRILNFQIPIQSLLDKIVRDRLS